MKRRLCLILAILMLVSIVGCDRTNPSGTEKNNDSKEPTINLNDTYKFYNNEDKILMKYNVKTGSHTTVCSDPVCEHDADCPFSQISMYTVSGDKVYFTKELIKSIPLEETIFENNLYSYSYETGELKELYSIEGLSDYMQGSLKVVDDYVYFYLPKPLEDEDELLQVAREYILCRVHCDGGEKEELTNVGSRLHRGGGRNI